MRTCSATAYPVGLCFVASLWVCPLAFALDDASVCADLRARVEIANSDGPLWTDHMTRFDGVVVHCGFRVIEFKHFLDAAPSDLRDGWQGRKQSQWNSIYCSDAQMREIIEMGWTVTDVITFASGERFRLVADCTGF